MNATMENCRSPKKKRKKKTFPSGFKRSIQDIQYRHGIWVSLHWFTLQRVRWLSEWIDVKEQIMFKENVKCHCYDFLNQAMKKRTHEKKYHGTDILTLFGDRMS